MAKKILERFSAQDFEDVYATAQMAHTGQKRRSGEDYFSHPSEVRNITRRFYPDDKVSQLAALLHDTIEDAPGSTVESEEEMEQFIRGSISDEAAGREVVRVVRALTHEKGGDYQAYVVDLMGDEPALRVKLADMVHNLSSSPSPKQKAKYKSAIDAISQQTGGSPPSGISQQHWDELLSLTGDQNPKENIMKIKKSDLAKIISEELNAVRMAIPAWLEEGNYDQLPQAGDPEEEARLKAQRDSSSIPNEPLERGARVKDIRTDREGSVISQMAGPGGGGAVVKFDDGKEEKVRMQFLQRGEPVKEEIGGEVLAMRDDPEALEQFAAKMAQAFGISPEEAMQKIQTAFGEVDKAMERGKYAKGGSAVGPMSEAGAAPMSLEDFKQLNPDTEMMPAIKQAEQWYLSNKATLGPDELAQYKDQIDQMHSILFMSDQEGDLSPEDAARVHRSMQERAGEDDYKVGDRVAVRSEDDLGGEVNYLGTITDLSSAGMVTVDMGKQGEATVSLSDIYTPKPTPTDRERELKRQSKEMGSAPYFFQEGAGHHESIAQAQNQGVAFIRGQQDKAAGKEKDPNFSEESGRNPLEVLFYNAGYDGDNAKAMQEGASSVGWSPDELLDFLRGQPSGVDAKMLAYAFGGQWQAQQAALEKMVEQGQLEKQGKMFVTAPGVEAAPNFEDEPIQELFGMGGDEPSMEAPELAQKIGEAFGEMEALGKQVSDAVMSGALPGDMMEVGQMISQGARDAEELVAHLNNRGFAQQMKEIFGFGKDDGVSQLAKQVEAAVEDGRLPTKFLPHAASLSRAAEAAEQAKEAMDNMNEEQEIFSRLREKALRSLREQDGGKVSKKPGPPKQIGQVDDKEAALRRIVADAQAGQVDGVEVDLYSASAIVKVLDALNPQNKERYLALDPLTMAEMAMKMMKEVKSEANGLVAGNSHASKLQEADDYRFDGNLRMDDVKAVMKKVGLQNADPNEIFDEYGHLDNLEQLENILSKRRDLAEYGVGMRQKTQYGVSGSGYGDAKPAAPAGKKQSPTQMAMAYMRSKGMDPSSIDVIELVDHLRQARAKDEQSVQAAVDNFLQMQEATNTIRESVSRFMKVTLREEGRRK